MVQIVFKKSLLWTLNPQTQNLKEDSAYRKEVRGVLASRQPSLAHSSSLTDGIISSGKSRDSQLGL